MGGSFRSLVYRLGVKQLHTIAVSGLGLRGVVEGNGVLIETRTRVRS